MTVRRTCVRDRSQGDGRPPTRVVPQRHGADHGRRTHGADRRRRAGRRRPDRRGRHGTLRARRRARGRRHRRHRDARDDRHPPAHVADGDAGVRRRLDADPVLRLVLPRARPAVPPRGHPRGQPAVRLGRSRGRRHHHRRLVPRPADRRPRRRRRRRPAVGARPVRARLRQHPGRALGVDGRPGREVVLRPAARRRRHARLPDRLRRARRGVLPRGSGVRLRPRARPRRTPRTQACGARPTTTASG